MPSQPRVTSPSRMICSSTVRASETGIAKPMPCEPPLCEKMALLTPIRLPAESTSAPPELPGFTAASVWMKSSKRLMPRWLRPRALTMPWVTVLPKPNGLPSANTASPTWTLSSLPKRYRRQVLAVGLEHCQIGFGVAAAYRRTQAAAVGEHELDVVGTLDHVIVGQHIAFGLTITPEPRLVARRGSPSDRSGKKRRSTGSSSSGLRCRTSLLV